MVAVPASQPDCSSCARRLDGPFAPHLCGSCGLPQPIGAGEDYFTALSAPKRFHQDAGLLEKKFYEVSRALHPDRFSGASLAARTASVERMSFLNQAYNTLKNRERLRAYLLGLEGLTVSAQPGQADADQTKPQIPMELAEAWFELQDALVEDPHQAMQQIPKFRAELAKVMEREEHEIRELEGRYDAQPSRQALEAMLHRLRVQGYLQSLERDVARKIESGRGVR